MYKILVFAAVLFTHSFGYSQEPLVPLTPKIIPPSPTVSALGKYGLANVGLVTGTVQQEIPIHVFKTRNLEVPISLSYSSNGVKVDEVSSWVGMQWVLNCGGVVNRIVRDDPDSYDQNPYPQGFSTMNVEGIRYLDEAGKENNVFDSESDLFTFNFLGYTGKFVFDRNGQTICMPRSDLSIQRLITSGPGGFVIVTPNGIRCTFQAAETSTVTSSVDQSSPSAVTAWYLTRVEHPQGDVINFTYASDYYSYNMGISQTTSRLLQNASCSNNPSVHCSFESSNVVMSGLQVHSKHIVKIEAANYGSIEFLSGKDRSDLGDYKLNTIVIKDENDAIVKGFELSYTFSANPTFTNSYNDYYEELKHRMFLTAVTEKDKDGVQGKKYSFNYEDINGLPSRLSFAQDHWGYFNGVSNVNLVSETPESKTIRGYNGEYVFLGLGANREPNFSYSSKGMLEKITYPTGGYSQYSYEPNSYYGQKTVTPTATPVTLYCSGHEGPLPVEKYVDVISPSNQIVQVFASSDLISGYTSTQAGAELLITDLNGSPVLAQQLSVGGSGNTFSAYIDMIANHTYRFKLIAKDLNGDPAIENNTVSYLNFAYYATASQVVNGNIETGGIRVSEVINFDPATNTTEELHYTYTRHDDLLKSSGQIAALPEYFTRYTVRHTCYVLNGPAYSTYDCRYGALHSNGVNNLFKTNGGNVYYRYVTISRGAGVNEGIEEHEFIVNFDNPGILMWGSEFIMESPLTNSAWDNGKEKIVRYYRYNPSVTGNLSLIKRIVKSYKKDPRYHVEVPALAVRRRFEPIEESEVIFECDETNINLVYYQDICVADHTHWYFSGPWASEQKCIASGADNQSVPYYWHACYGKEPGTTALLAYKLDHLDAVEYKNISEWVYMDKQREVTYDGDLDSLINETLFYYDNESHMQLSRSVTTTSQGDVEEVTTKYPDDYLLAQGQMVASLLDKHIVNAPIKREVVTGSNQAYGNTILYNTQGQVFSVYNYESTQLKAPVAHDAASVAPTLDYKLKSTFNYDFLTANLSSVQLTNNFGTSYLWGYGNSLPIAEIKNSGTEVLLVNQGIQIHATAHINADAYQGLLWPIIELTSSQTITSNISIAGQGLNLPSSPQLMLALKKSDGTIITEYSPVWSGNPLLSTALTPGVYQWVYSTNDPMFQEDRSYDLSVTTNCVVDKTVKRIFHTSFEDNGMIDPEAHTGHKVWSGTYQLTLPSVNGSYRLSYWQKSSTGSWHFNEQILSVTTGMLSK